MNCLLSITAIVFLAGMISVNAQAQSSNVSNVSESSHPNVVLVHGAWGGRFQLEQGHSAAAGKWLQRHGCSDPLTSLSDGVAVTQRVLAMQECPIILVGHSYGGVVIIEAAANVFQCSGTGLYLSICARR